MLRMAKALEQLVAHRPTCLATKHDVFDAIEVAFDGFCEAVRTFRTVKQQFFIVRKRYNSIPPEEMVDHWWIECQMESLWEQLDDNQSKEVELISLWEHRVEAMWKIYFGFDELDDHTEATQNLNSNLGKVSKAVQSTIRLTSKTCGEFAVSFGYPAA